MNSVFRVICAHILLVNELTRDEPREIGKSLIWEILGTPLPTWFGGLDNGSHLWVCVGGGEEMAEEKKKKKK